MDGRLDIYKLMVKECKRVILTTMNQVTEEEYLKEIKSLRKDLRTLLNTGSINRVQYVSLTNILNTDSLDNLA